MNVMTLWPEPNGQNVISEVSRLVPNGSQRRMTSDQAFISERFDPRKAIRIRPHRVVNAREVSVEFPASLFQKMWQQKGHLMHRQRKFLRPIDLAPHLRMRRRVNRLRHKLVPRVWKDAALGRDRGHQTLQ